jgi:hypothetical protein
LQPERLLGRSSGTGSILFVQNFLLEFSSLSAKNSMTGTINQSTSGSGSTDIGCGAVNYTITAQTTATTLTAILAATSAASARPTATVISSRVAKPTNAAIILKASVYTFIGVAYFFASLM